MLQLESYKGTKSRHICPSCGARGCFVRYVGDDGNYIDETVGKCNRESKCAYHRKPREFFADNPYLSKSATFKPKGQARTNGRFAAQTVTQSVTATKTALIRPDYISSDVLLRTLGNYENNAFVSFLFSLFPEDSEAVEKAVKDYLIGTTKDNRTIFWQIGASRNIRTGKIIAYHAQTGKRRKDINPNWIHSELKKSGHLKTDFNLTQCFFGLHLLPTAKEQPLAICEAEKTAIIGSICFPQFVWLACGAKGYLNADKLQRFSKRKIILYPDADAFKLWTDKAKEARSNGLTVKVSSLIEKHATAKQKADGYDLADYLIAEQQAVNYLNDFTDEYNAKLETVLNDKTLRKQFDLVLNEQKAVMIYDGGLSDIEAEFLITRPANLRRVVMMV